MEIIEPEQLLEAYMKGYFPMAEKNGELYWHNPNPRAIIPLDNVKPNRSMMQVMKKRKISFTVNQDFPSVIHECSNRSDTWISDKIIESYINLHCLGFAHSVETWENGEMTGGLYGVAIGGAFFGESMFSKKSDSSKAAFYFLINKLRNQDFLLLDSQYLNDFTEQLGAVEIPRNLYLRILRNAVDMPVKF